MDFARSWLSILVGYIVVRDVVFSYNETRFLYSYLALLSTVRVDTLVGVMTAGKLRERDLRPRKRPWMTCRCP
jgi:hypothetical protein